MAAADACPPPPSFHSAQSLETGTGTAPPSFHSTKEAAIDATAATGPTPITWDTPLPAGLAPALYTLTPPQTWPARRKTTTLALSCLSTFLAAYTAGAYSASLPPLPAPRLALLAGTSVFTTGFGIAPMVTAPISEAHGRLPVFYASYLLFIACHVGMACTHSLAGVLLSRFWAGVAASTFSTLCGGVLADIYPAAARGGPMALFSTAALAGTGVGPLASGFLAGANWRWIHWTQAIANGAAFALILLLFPETRANALLQRRASAINAAAGTDTAFVAGQELGLREMLRRSLTRPFVLLTTEPVVAAFSAWVAFAWGILFLFLAAIPLVFASVHAFTPSQCGLVFAAMIAGSLLALPAVLLIARLTPRHHAARAESRLYAACTLGTLLPAGLFLFGLTATAQYHWAAPAAGVALATVGIFTIYLAVFNYFCDCYGAWASSALAAQSFARNMLAGVFPLVTDRMYGSMGFRGGSVMLGGVAAGLAVVPWVLVWRGESIRGRSWVVKEIMG
ncbi:major facilitator superfamily domain-containing protein [Geopyxis carbonaria]|nr:major facilitator superfamily domain-containing protein [Geopyxis carbonaria]